MIPVVFLANGGSVRSKNPPGCPNETVIHMGCIYFYSLFLNIYIIYVFPLFPTVVKPRKESPVKHLPRLLTRCLRPETNINKPFRISNFQRQRNHQRRERLTLRPFGGHLNACRKARPGTLTRQSKPKINGKGLGARTLLGAPGIATRSKGAISGWVVQPGDLVHHLTVKQRGQPSIVCLTHSHMMTLGVQDWFEHGGSLQWVKTWSLGF